MSNIYLEVDGEMYEGFTDIAVNSSLENFCSSFSFSTTVQVSTGGFVNNIKLQSPVRVYIEKKLILTGFIENLDMDYSAGGHSITYSGRDIGGDIVDSSIIQKTYNQRNFEVLLQMVLKENGFTKILVVNKAGLLTLEKNEKINTEKGEKIFDFIDRYAKKLQVLLRINEFGNLEITREDDEVVKNMLINNRSDDNNILSASLQLSTKDRFNVIQVYSQANNKTHTKTAISQKGKASDILIRATRRLTIDMNTASESKTLSGLAQWNINVRRAKGSRYSCKVVDFYSESLNKVWRPNTLVDITDDIAQILGTFLIQGVQFTKNTQGSFTTLDIVERGSFNDVKPSILSFASSFADGLIQKP